MTCPTNQQPKNYRKHSQAFVFSQIEYQTFVSKCLKNLFANLENDPQSNFVGRVFASFNFVLILKMEKNLVDEICLLQDKLLT